VTLPQEDVSVELVDEDEFEDLEDDDASLTAG
jgi:hypothetical protein